MRLNKLMIAFFAAVALGLTACGDGDSAASADQNPALDCVMTRSSIRSFKSKEVSEAKVEAMLRAAMAAPTAVNKQPWAFVVVTDRAILDAVADSIGSMRMAHEAPMAIVTCGNMAQALEGDAHNFWIQDVSAATENLLLAAHSMGLGAVWCGVYPLSDRVAFISQLLNLPDEIVPLAFVPIGYPAVEPQIKEKWDSAKVRYNTWAAPANP